MSTIPGGFDPAVLQRLIERGQLLETSAGLVVSDQPHVALQPALVEQEKNLLAAVLLGPADQRQRWGVFRRAIGLRFDEPVPSALWSDAGLRGLAVEIDALPGAQCPVVRRWPAGPGGGDRCTVSWSP